MKTFLVIYGIWDSNVYIKQAKTVAELLCGMSDYFGEWTDLIKRALVGCQNASEMVEMFNTLIGFPDHAISKLMAIEEVLYTESSTKR